MTFFSHLKLDKGHNKVNLEEYKIKVFFKNKEGVGYGCKALLIDFNKNPQHLNLPLKNPSSIRRPLSKKGW